MAHLGTWTFSSKTSNLLFELQSVNTNIQNVTVNGLPGCVSMQNCTLSRSTYVDFTSNTPVNCSNTAPSGGVDRVAGEILPSDYNSTWAGTLTNSSDDSIAMALGGAGDWHATTTYATTESFILPRTGNAGTYGFQATTGGTSGSCPPGGCSTPNWPQTTGAIVTDGGVTWTNIGKLIAQGPAFDYVSYRPPPGTGCSRINTRIGIIYRGNGNSQPPAGTWQTDNTSLCPGGVPCNLPDLMTLHDGGTFGNGAFVAVTPTGGETHCAGGSPGFVEGQCSCLYHGPTEHDYCDGYFWELDSLLVRPCLDLACEGHSAKGYNLNFRGKFYTSHSVSNPTINGNPGNANPGVNVFDPNNPFPTDQHGTYNNGGPQDAQPVFAMSAWVPAAGRIGPGYTPAWSGEEVATIPDGSHKTYRFAHSYNTGSVVNFNGQNGIGNVSQDGRFLAIPTDMMGLRGSISGDWPGLNRSVSLGTTINPINNNTGNYTYRATTQGTTCNTTNCEPNFDSSCVTTCTDGSVGWTRTASPCDQLRGDYGWSNGGTVSTNDQLFPISNNSGGSIFQAQNGGSMPNSQPNWDSVAPTYGQTVTDTGGITWKNIGANDCRTDIMVIDLKSAHGN